MNLINGPYYECEMTEYYSPYSGSTWELLYIC